jgi:hypothetical protein
MATTTAQHTPAAERGRSAPRWVPERIRTALILLVAGVGTLATSFAALPTPVLAVIVAVWCLAVVWFASPASGTLGFTVLSICVKVPTLYIIALLIFDPTSPIGAQNGLYWIPLGLLNMGSGLWFLSLIRHRAR